MCNCICYFINFVSLTIAKAVLMLSYLLSLFDQLVNCSATAASSFFFLLNILAKFDSVFLGTGCWRLISCITMRFLIRSWLCRTIFYNFTCNISEELVNIGTSFSWAFKECKAVCVSKFLTLLCRDDSVWKVNFVGNKHFHHSLACMSVNLFQPICDVCKCSLLCAVIDQDDSHSPFVICLSNCSKSFLSSSIPYLELDSLVIDQYGFDFEIDS